MSRCSLFAAEILTQKITNTMADTVTFLQNGYAGEVLEDLLTYTAQGNDTYREGLIHIKSGIQHKYTPVSYTHLTLPTTERV